LREITFTPASATRRIRERSQVGIDHIVWADSLKVFLGGFAMPVTPGKG
jgi:hypothetical protein